MGVDIPSHAIADSQAAGELWDVVLAIAGPESGWNPRARGDWTIDGVRWFTEAQAPAGAWPTSFGYLQMHTPGGLGDGHSIDELLDGPTNFRLGAEYIRYRLGMGSSLWDAMSPWSARPAAWALLERIRSEGITGVSGPGPTPIPDPWIEPPAGYEIPRGAAVAVLVGMGLIAWWLVS